MGSPKDKQRISLDLSPEELKDLKEFAQKANLPTKALSEFLMKNIIREAKQGKGESLLSKFRNAFRS